MGDLHPPDPATPGPTLQGPHLACGAAPIFFFGADRWDAIWVLGMGFCFFVFVEQQKTTLGNCLQKCWRFIPGAVVFFFAKLWKEKVVKQ